MILPIVAYGHPILKKVAIDVAKDEDLLDTLLDNMWETMYEANGIGLAAPQINRSIRLFLVDTKQLEEKEDSDFTGGIKKAFINPTIIEFDDETTSMEEGCLSIPFVDGEVNRPVGIKIKYFDKEFKAHTEEYTGLNARVIQHEFDHIEGKLFIEQLSLLKKKLIKGKLQKIAKGKIDPPYKMKFPKQ